MSTVDVFVGNFPVIDWELYSLWVEGLTAVEAIHVLREKGVLASFPGVKLELLVSDLNDNYRLFTMWETMLHLPLMFSDQLVYQLDSVTQGKLIEMYYDLDNKVIRELLGRKFSSRLRKDLDEVAEKTSISLRSCRRQFDNIKRVFKTVEEMPGNLQINIRKNFMLPTVLAEKYSVISFVAYHRLETSKRKLSFLSFEDFSVVAKTIMKNWTNEEVDVDESGEPCLDRDFLTSLRDLRCLGEKEKEHRYAVCQLLGRNNLAQRPLSEIEANFKNMNKNIVNLGQTLYRNTELKDLFVNVVDKIVESLKQCKLNMEDLNLFLSAYCKVVTDETVQVDFELRNNFEKYMMTLNVLIINFYRRFISRT